MGNVIIRESSLLSGAITMLRRLSDEAVIEFDSSQATVHVRGNADGVTAALTLTEDAKRLLFHVNTMETISLSLNDLNLIFLNQIDRTVPVTIRNHPNGGAILEFLSAGNLPQLAYNVNGVNVNALLWNKMHSCTDSTLKVTTVIATTQLQERYRQIVFVTYSYICRTTVMPWTSSSISIELSSSLYQMLMLFILSNSTSSNSR